MADTTVNSKVQIEVGVSGDSSVKSIKQELREAKNEAINMARQFGENSTQATEAAKRVAKLKDEIEDVGLKIKGVNPDKFQRLAELGSGIANGFAAAQGAMALFGSESKDLEKQMAKVQGAIALSQGLQGLKDLRLMLSGVNVYVLALSAAVTLVVKYWKEFSEAITKSFPGFQVVVDFFKTFQQTAAGAINSVTTLFKDLGSGIWKLLTGHFSDAYDVFSNIGKDMAVAFNEGYDKKDKELKLEKSIKDRKFQLDLLEAQGKDVLNARLQLAKDELKLIEEEGEAKNAKLIEIAKIETQIRQKAAEEKKKIDDEAAKEWKKKQDEAQQKIIDDGKYNEYLANLEAKRLLDIQKENDEKAKKEDEWIKSEMQRLQKEADERILFQTEETQRKKKLIQEGEKELISTGFQALLDLTAAFDGKTKEQQKKAFELNKAISIAKAIVNTYEGASKAAATYAEFPPLAAAMVAAQIALGIAQVKKISEQKFPEEGKASSGSLSSPSFQAPAISQSIDQQRQIMGSQTGASGTIQQTNTTKVIVTETDITRVQNRTKDIQRRATVR